MELVFSNGCGARDDKFRSDCRKHDLQPSAPESFLSWSPLSFHRGWIRRGAVRGLRPEANCGSIRLEVRTQVPGKVRTQYSCPNESCSSTIFAGKRHSEIDLGCRLSNPRFCFLPPQCVHKAIPGKSKRSEGSHERAANGEQETTSNLESGSLQGQPVVLTPFHLARKQVVRGSLMREITTKVILV